MDFIEETVDSTERHVDFTRTNRLSQLLRSIVHSTSEWGCQFRSIHAGLLRIIHGTCSNRSAGGRFVKATASSRAIAQARP